MTKSLLIGAASAALFAAPAFGDTQTFDLDGFSKIKAERAVDVVFEQGDYSVVAETAGDDFSQLKITIDGDVLVDRYVNLFHVLGWWGYSFGNGFVKRLEDLKEDKIRQQGDPNCYDVVAYPKGSRPIGVGEQYDGFISFVEGICFSFHASLLYM